jgi:hypothetical protein
VLEAMQEGAPSVTIDERALEALLDGIDVDTAAPPRRRAHLTH